MYIKKVAYYRIINVYQKTRTKRCRIIQRIIRLFLDEKKDAQVHTLAHNKRGLHFT